MVRKLAEYKFTMKSFDIFKTILKRPIVVTAWIRKSPSGSQFKLVLQNSLFKLVFWSQ